MVKSVFKEIIIILLLLLIIILLLGILLYDYMPNSKTVPAKVQEYALQESIQQEIEKELDNLNSEEIVKTYQLDSIDIENYERANEYNKGKVNPFAVYSPDVSNTEDNNNTNNNNTNNNNINNNQTSNIERDPSKDNFLGTTGK